MGDMDELWWSISRFESNIMFSVYSEVGKMKTGDYMIHVSTHSQPFLVLNDLTLVCLIRYTSFKARISRMMNGKSFFRTRNP